MKVLSGIRNTLSWIATDFKSNPLRMIGEIYGWAVSLTTAIVFAFTVPNPPLFFVYPLWMSGTIVLAGCAWSRGSVGLLMLNLSMFLFDVIGYARLLMGSN